jgi:hypothetical protein
MDAMMMTLVMNKIFGGKVDEQKVSPFSVSIELSATSLSSSVSGNKALIRDLGAEDWFKETEERIAPIMKEQTIKFAEIFSKKFHCDYVDILDNPSDFHDFFEQNFRGSEVGE